jgi:hypothetical protein
MTNLVYIAFFIILASTWARIEAAPANITNSWNWVASNHPYVANGTFVTRSYDLLSKTVSVNNVPKPVYVAVDQITQQMAFVDGSGNFVWRNSPVNGVGSVTWLPAISGPQTYAIDGNFSGNVAVYALTTANVARAVIDDHHVQLYSGEICDFSICCLNSDFGQNKNAVTMGQLHNGKVALWVAGQRFILNFGGTILAELEVVADYTFDTFQNYPSGIPAAFFASPNTTAVPYAAYCATFYPPTAASKRSISVPQDLPLLDQETAIYNIMEHLNINAELRASIIEQMETIKMDSHL